LVVCVGSANLASVDEAIEWAVVLGNATIIPVKDEDTNRRR
jgi:hypothetical protein